MKCSSCSEVVRPVFVSDIDGTLAQYHSHLAYFICIYFDLAPGTIMRAMEWDGSTPWHEVFEITQKQYREAKLAFRQGGMKRSMPLFPDLGSSLIRDMYQQGCEIWYATTRPWQRLDNIDPDTRFWLERHNLPIDGLMFDDMKYEKLVTDFIDPERIVLILEDLPEQVDAARDLELPVVQIARPHNGGPGQSRPGRVDMDRARSQALANLREWRIDHG